MSGRDGKPADWVQDLLQNWINQITSESTLDHLLLMIQKRKLKLQIVSADEQIDRLIASYKECSHGETLWLIEPYGSHSAVPMSDKDKLKYQRVKFHCYQPRKKLLWLILPWLPRNRATVRFRRADIERYQPARTEPEVRKRIGRKRL